METHVGPFWDNRYQREGAIWGDGPSPTAMLAAGLVQENSRVLEIGCGYGRDLSFLAQQCCRVSGIELSPVGCQMTRRRLQERGVQVEQLCAGPFETCEFPPASFDLVLCHRVAHLLLTPEAVGRFAGFVTRVLRAEGWFCLGVRDRRDRNPEAVVPVGGDVYEYRHRPGHRIRYWDAETCRRVFARDFSIPTLVSAVEGESASHPVPCRLIIMLARKRPVPAPRAGDSAAGDSSRCRPPVLVSGEGWDNPAHGEKRS